MNRKELFEVLNKIKVWLCDFLGLQISLRLCVSQRSLRFINYNAKIAKDRRGSQSVNEVMKIVRAKMNIKHRTMLMTGYAAGLRVSEIVKLKVRDIDSERMVIHVRGAKGKKDRQVMLSKKLLEQLRVYYRSCRPKDFLFESQFGVLIRKEVYKRFSSRPRMLPEIKGRAAYIVCDIVLPPIC